MQPSEIRRSGIDWGGVEQRSYRGEFEGRFHIPSLPPLPRMTNPNYEATCTDQVLGLANVQGLLLEANRKAQDDPPFAIVQLMSASDAIERIVENRQVM